MKTIRTKYKKLIEILESLSSVAVGFSGGVDSTFLLATSKEALGAENVLGVIGRSPTYPKREYKTAIGLAEKIGVPYEIVDTNEIANPKFTINPPNRCYVCKNTLFKIAWKVAIGKNIENLLEGSNADDSEDFRPGMKAARDLGVRAPLLEAGLTKNEIRALSKEMGLSTWNKPAMACLSSRIPYGETINEEILDRIEQSENTLKDMGIEQVRVRDHGNIARIEVPQKDVAALTTPETRERIVQALKQAGYTYVCVDLEGYRTGAMNEALTEQQQEVAV